MKKANTILLSVATAAVALAAPGIYKAGGIKSSSLLHGESSTFSSSGIPSAESTEAAPQREVVGNGMNKIAKAPENAIWFESLDTQEAYETFTVIDANNDGKTWRYVPYYSMPSVGVHNDNNSDDWLITTKIPLEAGKLYKFTVDLRISSKSSLDEYFVVKAGNAPTVEGMTQVVIDKTQIPFPGYDENSRIPMTTFTGYIKAETAGDYYVGLQALSYAGAWGFYACNFTVYTGISLAGPEAVTDLQATAYPDGVYKADVSFVAPTTTTTGDALESIQDIKVYRGEELVKTFEAPAPGVKCEFTDELASAGDYTYKVVPYSIGGEGKGAEVEVYVGTDYAVAPVVKSLVELETDGKIRFEWEPVNKDVNGNDIAADKITYTIARINDSGNLVDVVEGLTDTVYETQCVVPGDQMLVQYVVFASTDRGLSEGTGSEAIVAGTPYAVPWKESFPDGTLSCVMGTKALRGNCTWRVSQDTSFQNMHSADNDNGYASFWTTANADQGRLYTGKFKLEGLKNPGVSFYIWKRVNGTTPDIGTIEVEINDGTGFKTIKTVTAESTPVKGWNLVNVPIPAEYIGKVIQVGFKATRVTYTYQFIDALQIHELCEHNVAVASVSVPKRAVPDSEFEISATVTNHGTNLTGAYAIDLLRNGELVQSIAGPALQPEASGMVQFKEKLNVSHGSEHKYSVKVNYAADGNAADDLSQESPLTLKISQYPAPENLAAVSSSEGAELTWNAPEYSKDIRDALTDDFESYESFVNDEAGDWTFVDLDKGLIGGLNDGDKEIVIPGISMNTQQAWWVMDNSVESLNSINSFQSNSGSKYLAQQYIVGGGQVDDWAISPEVAPVAQTISFYARSFSGSDLETLEVLASSTGRATEDFTAVKTFENMMAAWAKYTVELPEGTKYFALRCRSTYKFMLFIDDVEFIPVGFYGLNVEGYNIYRNGVKINAAPIEDTSFVDANAPKDVESVYSVSCVFNKGESATSGKASLTVSGIESIANTNNEVFDIYSVDGLKVSKDAKSLDNLPKGVYIINGKKIVK